MMKILGIPQADFVTGIQEDDQEQQGNVAQCHWDSLAFLSTALALGIYPSQQDVVAIFKVNYIQQHPPPSSVL